MKPPQTRLPLLGFGIVEQKATGSAITDSYVAIGNTIDMENATGGFIHIFYTAGDETSIEVKFDYSQEPTGTFAQSTIITTAAATSVISPVEFQYATAGGSKNISIPFGVEGTFCKISIKATGGSPSGTYGASVYLPRE